MNQKHLLVLYIYRSKRMIFTIKGLINILVRSKSADGSQ